MNIEQNNKIIKNKSHKIIIVLGIVFILILSLIIGAFLFSKKLEINNNQNGSTLSSQNSSSFKQESNTLESLNTTNSNNTINNEQPTQTINKIDSSKTIFQVISQEPSFSIFLKALNLSNITNLLNSKDGTKYTVFIPTDRAFSKLKSSTLESWLSADNLINLKQLVNYHIINGIYDSKKLINAKNVQTLQGQSINIMQDQQKIILDNSSTLVEYDIPVQNGMIHIIDTVLNPL